MATTSTHLTLEQYAALSDAPCKQELLNGQVYESDSDFRCHYFSQEVGRALTKLLPATEFDVYFPLSMKFPNTEYATVLRPDVSVFRVRDLPKPHEVEEQYLSLHPLLICEGLYPGQDEEFLCKKLDVYKKWGVPWLWSLDVHHRRVLVEGPTGRQWHEHEFNLESPFPPLRFDLEELFKKVGAA